MPPHLGTTPFPFGRGMRGPDGGGVRFFGPGPGHFGHGGPNSLEWAIFALILATLLLLLALAAMRLAGGPGRRRRWRRMGHGPDALAVVRHRYARGELSRD